MLAWAPDNSGFYAQTPFSNDPKFLTATIQLLYFYDLAGEKSVQVPLDWENGAGRDLHTEAFQRRGVSMPPKPFLL